MSEFTAYGGVGLVPASHRHYIFSMVTTEAREFRDWADGTVAQASHLSTEEGKL